MADNLKFPLNIAVYGTLREGFGNHGLISRGDTEKVGKGKTVGFHTLTAHGIPFVKKDTGDHRVVVEVYQVNDLETLSDLDSLEGHPRWYKREIEKIELEDGSVVDAWLYFNEEQAPTVITSGDYEDYRQKRSYSY